MTHIIDVGEDASGLFAQKLCKDGLVPSLSYG